MSVEFKFSHLQNYITESYGFKEWIMSLSNQKAGLSLPFIVWSHDVFTLNSFVARPLMSKVPVHLLFEDKLVFCISLL
jgi:hypothetical protein